MATVQRKLVHKQFNSPMGLYSQQNVKETLDRELKAFGADGIEVDPEITKPLNLANSAVLRAVEEEEQMKCGYKRVAWPPVSEERVVREFTPQPTSAHYPVSAPYQPQQQQQQPAQQHQPQHLQQQPSHQQQQPNAAPTSQGPIYNNVSRAGSYNPAYHSQEQQQQQQYPQQQVYQQSPLQQRQQQQHYEPPQQPIQYTQAQFNRQPSHEPAGPPPSVSVHYGQQQKQPAQQTLASSNYPFEQQQQQQQQYEPSSPSGWRPIQPPVPKAYNEFVRSPVGGAHVEPFYPSYGQHQQQQQQHLTQQYRATSYDQYQAQPQQYQPHQGSQPPYGQQPYYQPQQQQQQQQPSWAHNQPAPLYQPTQAPYQQAPPSSQQQYQAPPPSNYQSQPYHQQQPQFQPQQYSSVPQSNQYNSYSQPPQHIGQDQPDQRALPVHQQQQAPQPLPQEYRGGSPGIITLRKEAPVTQKPAPVYNAQPAAVSFQGGSNMRGDLKWPPPEYKEAAVRENEERRKLAQGPVCRPRKVNRDYTTFFAKNALNSYYPSYKVPPGTQHMLA